MLTHGTHNNQHESEMSVKMRNTGNDQGEKGEKKLFHVVLAAEATESNSVIIKKNIKIRKIPSSEQFSTYLLCVCLF